MTSEETDVLVTLLAFADELFAPWTDFDNYRVTTVVYERRRDYAVCGVPWTSSMTGGKLDDDGRKAIERATKELAADGLVKASSQRGTRIHGLRLTDAGDDYARAFLGLPTIRDAHPLLARLVEQSQGPDAFDEQGATWVREDTLGEFSFGLPPPERRAAIAEVEQRLLPALVRGLAVSGGDVARRVSYALTAAGRRWLKKNKAPPPAAAAVGQPCTHAHLEFYADRRADAADALAAAAPRDARELGLIPLSLSPITRAMLQGAAASSVQRMV